MKRWAFGLIPLLGMVLASWTVSAGAQTYPSRPVRIIVPYGAGTATDTIVRQLAPKLSAAWGQSVVAENVTGAGGVVGTQALVKSSPDGHTLAMVAPNHVINPAAYPNLPFDPIRDIKPVGNVAFTQLLLVTNPAVPAGTLPEFIALVKANPGKFNYGSSGNGSILHLSVELLAHTAGINMIHVPYKTVGASMADLLGGQVSLISTAIITTLSNVKSGKLRALAVTGARRSPLLPDVPTVAESGMAGYQVVSWNGLIAPAATPDAVVSKIFADVSRVFRDKEFADQLVAQGVEVELLNSEAFGKRIAAELPIWGKLIRDAGVKFD